MVFLVMLCLTAERSHRASDALYLGAPASSLVKPGIVRAEEANPFAQPATPFLW